VGPGRCPPDVRKAWRRHLGAGRRHRRVLCPTQHGGSRHGARLVPGGRTHRLPPAQDAWHIDVIPASGGSANRIATVGESLESFAWSPDGHGLAYRGARGVRRAGVLDGASAPMDLPTVPAFSPDGTRIAYTEAGDLYVANADGSNPTQLTDSLRDVYGPEWAPDASHLVFAVKKSRTSSLGDLYAVRADGEELTKTGLQGIKPSWSPMPAPPSAPSLAIVSPAPGPTASLPLGTRSATIRVAVERAQSGWNWRLDEPFPVTGVAGGTHVAGRLEAIVGGLQPGREHAIYVALVDERGDMLAPPVVGSVSVLAPRAAAADAATDETHIAYVSRTRNRLHLLRANGTERATAEADVPFGLSAPCGGPRTVVPSSRQTCRMAPD
jgi:hypothetical protein